MNKEVIFDVLRNVRFNVLGGVELPTINEFCEMDFVTKDQLYYKMYEAWCSTCETLSALMTIEDNCKQMQSK